MAGIFANIDSDIQKLRKLKAEIEGVKKSLMSINVKVDIDIADGLQKQLTSLLGQYDALVNKIAESEGKIMISVNRINKATEKIIQAQEAVSTPPASGNSSSEPQGVGARAQTSSAETESIKAQAKAYEDLKTAIEDASGSVNQNIVLMMRMQETVNRYKKELKELEKGPRTDESVDRMAEITAEIEKGKIAIADYRRAFQNSLKIEYAASGSMNELSQQLGKMRSVYRDLTEEERNSPFGKELLASIQQADAKIKELDASIGNHQRNVGNYGSAFEALGGKLSDFASVAESVPGPVGRIASSIKGVTKASLAFIATPIGLFLASISAALATLTSWFNRTEEGQNALNIATSYFSGTLNTFLDVVDNVGESIWNAFTKPKEALGDLVDFLKGQVMNRLKAFGKAGEAVYKIFSGDIVEGMYDLDNAIKQGITGIEDPNKKISSFFKDTKQNAEERMKIAKRQNLLDVKERDMLVEKAKLESKISDLRAKAYDQSISEKERSQAIKEANKLTDEMYDKEISLAKERYEIIRDTNSLSHSNKADKKAEAEAEAKLYQLETQRRNSQRMLTMQSNSISNKQEKAADKQKEDQQKSAEELLSLRRQNQQAEIGLMKEGIEKELKQIDLNYQKKLDAIKKQEKELSERQGGKLTQEQSVEISALYTNAENERDKAIADVTKNQLKAEANAMREYLKEYGTFQQKKLAIAEEYAEKIKKATTEGEKLSLGRERDSAIQQIDINALNQKIDWQSVFGNFSGILGSQLKETLDGLKAYVNTDKFKNSSEADKKVIYEAIDRLREVTPGGEGTLNFNKIQQQMDGLGAAINRLQTATLNQEIASQNLKKAENDYANALKTGDKGAIDSARQVLDLAKLGTNAANDAYKSAEVEVQNFGNNLKDVGADTVDGLNSVASGLQGFADRTLPGIFRGLQNTLTGLSKLNIGGAVGDAIGKLSQTLSSAGVIGQIISAILSILDILKDGIGPLISSIIDTVLNAVNGILDNILSGDMFVQIFSSIKDGIGNILNTISFGGFNTLMGKISGSNAKEVQEAIDRLTDRNETLEKSIDRLTDVMEKSAGSKAISAYEQAFKYQQEQITNTLEIAQKQAGYHGSHKSWQHYMEWTDEQLRWARENVDKNFSGTGSLWGLSPEQMKMLLSNADIYEQIKNEGKGGYGGRVLEKLEAYADQAGKLDELTEKINESLMQVSFDGLRDSFLEALMDMDKDAKSFSEDFSEYMQRALLNFSMGGIIDEELKAWYDGIAGLMKEQGGKLTKQQIEDARKEYDSMVQKAMDERDKISEITGYTGSSSSSSQEASKKGFATASQDSIDELNGRFTALQIAGEEIKNQNQQQTMSILELKAEMLPIIANTSGIKDIASETRDLLQLSYEAIADIRDNTNVIVKPIQQMASDIAEVKRNTNGLSRK